MSVAVISQEVLARLFVVLKGWAGDMDAFRYEMFARRLVAAEHGRPDAVEWAQAWYNDLVAEERATEEAQQQRFAAEAAEREARRTEFRAGRCSNPNYQLFLDTVENPEQVENNVEFMAWISRLLTRFEKMPNLSDMPTEERDRCWRAILQADRDANLAQRLRTP